MQHPHEAKRRLATAPLLPLCLSSCHVIIGRRFSCGSNPLLDEFLLPTCQTDETPYDYAAQLQSLREQTADSSASRQVDSSGTRPPEASKRDQDQHYGICGCGHIRLLLFPSAGAVPLEFLRLPAGRAALASPRCTRVQEGQEEAGRNSASSGTVLTANPARHSDVGSLEERQAQGQMAEQPATAASPGCCSPYREELIATPRQSGDPKPRETENVHEEAGRDCPHSVVSSQPNGSCGGVHGHRFTLIVFDGTWTHAQEMFNASAPYIGKHCLQVCMSGVHCQRKLC